ncbi:flagellar hook protein FlgE [Halanaerobium sp. Z-7514]|uniref:Flagellar hook protein FlgE n=1 Tax=Halanaerobium polyolivorans TaxID=2886943 RepID=A0AAW4X069_9FIRM|nr:flagellar hook protein FlgE [Halanaerobium polyolivorans]MCC3145201.1 flagellar hook protein FlgE [Halanaerobium polyolivorans]
MLRSMYAGVSGLDSHQEMMDVIGNNISNVNTVGFKSSRVTFQEMLTQTIQGASAADDARGGTNAQQVGLGTSVASIDNNMTSGNLESTGQGSDVAIQGDGFFVLREGQTQSYSRAGNFGFDENGNLYSLSNGKLVQGWLADADGEFGAFNNDSLGDIVLQNSINAQQTSRIDYGRNLDSALENELNVVSQNLNLEANGLEDSLRFSLEPADNSEFNEWNFSLEADDENTDINGNVNPLTGIIRLDADGNLLSFADDDGNDLIDNIEVTLSDGTTTGDIDLNTAAIDESLNAGSLLEVDGDPDSNLELGYQLNTERNIAVDVYDSQGEKHTVELLIKKTDNNTWEIEDESLEVSGTNDGSVELEGGNHEIIFNDNGNIISGETANIAFIPNGPEVEQNIELDFSRLTQFANSMTATSENVNGNSNGVLESFSFTETGNIEGSYDNGLNQTLAKLALADFSNPSGLQRKEGVFEDSANSGDPDIGAAAQDGKGSLAPANLEMSNANLSEEFTNMITAQRGFQANSRVITTSDEMLQELVNLKR